MTNPTSGHEIAEKVQRLLASIESPLPLSGIAKQRKQLHLACTQKALQAAVDQLVRSGRLHQHPPTKKGGAAAYHAKPVVEFVCERLRQTLAASRPSSEASLRKSVPKRYQPYFDEALGRLIESGSVRPTVFLSRTRVGQLERALATINKIRLKGIELKALLSFLDGPQEPLADEKLREEQLVEWYALDLPRLEGIRSVPIPWTWKRYEEWCRARGVTPSLRLFQSLLLAMSARAAVGLTPHDNPGRVPQEETQVLPPTPMGYAAYYWTILE